MFEDLIDTRDKSQAVLSPLPDLRRRGLYLFSKRAFDIALVVATAPVAAVMIGSLAFLVRLDGGPAFYAQARLGKDGRVFKLWKLRSMVTDAEAALQRHLAADPEAKAEWDLAQKLKHDPRITRIGRLLRKYSLDELPQLFNVLIGDMSLVGPRPMAVEQRPMYPGRAYFDFRPGLTGLWQVGARNSSTFAERARYDDRYAQEVSFLTDTRIIMQTASVVLRGTGI